MNNFKKTFGRATILFAVFTILCGVIYTGAVTGIAQLALGDRANGSIIEIDGKKYGSELLGQQFTDNGHMWGRVMKIDIATYADENGNPLMYSSPSNISPASEEYKVLIAERVAKIRASNPARTNEPIPVDLVTGSGSGLDPHISVAAAMYQVARIAEATGSSEVEIRRIVDKCTSGKLFGLLGEETVNVLKVNLMIDGILE